MFSVRKRMEVAGAHRLDLSYNSPCQNLHGHNWIIEVEVSGRELNREGMLIDFTHIKKVVNQLDHHMINDVISGQYPLNPTAENLCQWIAVQVDLAIEEEWRKVALALALATFKPGVGATAEEIDDETDEQMGVMHIPKVSEVVVQESEGNVACYKTNIQ